MIKIEKLFKALSDRNRLRIIAALREHDGMCACQLVELLDVSGATTSKHLSILLNVGLISNYKEGRWVHYRLDYSGTESDQVMGWLKEKLFQTDTIRSDNHALDAIMAVDREVICRKQRGEKCCPK